MKPKSKVLYVRHKRHWHLEELSPAELRVKKNRSCPECGTYDPKRHEESFHDDIIYCPLHRSAQDLLDVLIFLAKQGPLPETCYYAIAKAEGRDRPIRP